ncbi:MAG TPA: HIT domain-containing protein [Ktedonobacterales bacterium]|nr:HIT domain-containing protein [Ktedonobacterales bacterium]
MQRLWAPWRMTYIKGDDSQEQTGSGCIFCDKVAENRDEENLILARAERCFVIMNLYPYNNGHLMIAPYAHLPGIQQLDAPTLTEVMTTAQKCLTALGATMGPQGYNIGINQGAVAGAGIADHMHVHIVPRWNGDTNFMPVLADVKVMPDFLANTYQQIRKELTPLMAAPAKTRRSHARHT